MEVVRAAKSASIRVLVPNDFFMPPEAQRADMIEGFAASERLRAFSVDHRETLLSLVLVDDEPVDEVGEALLGVRPSATSCASGSWPVASDVAAARIGRRDADVGRRLDQLDAAADNLQRSRELRRSDAALTSGQAPGRWSTQLTASPKRLLAWATPLAVRVLPVAHEYAVQVPLRCLKVRCVAGRG